MNKKASIFLYISAAIAAIAVFQITFTFHVLNPTNVNWLMTVRDDWGGDYLGWFFYRNEHWTFPLGNISRYYFSPGTNIGFTDSIPLMAIFFKLFAPILPANFQYFGIWLLLCDLLLAFYTVKLLRLFGMRSLNILLAVLFVVANPVLVYRGMHPSLCAHWLLMGSLYNYFRDPAIDGPRKVLYHQLFLLLVSAAVTPYLGGMILGLTVAVAIKLYRYDKVTGRKDFIRYMAGCVVGLLLVWFLIGLIDFGKKADLGVGGAYGLYSMNLNALYNSGGWSAFLPAFKQVGWYQFEGFMYLGLGVLLLLGIVLIYSLYSLAKDRAGRPRKDSRIVRKNLRVNGTYLMPLVILLIVYTLFAITQNISFNDKILLRIPLPRFLTDLGDIFRASARFFWLPYYVILLITIIVISRFRIWWPLGSALLLGALVLQYYDNKHLLTFRRFPDGEYTPPLDKGWATLMGQFDNIAFYPPFEAQQLVRMDYQDFSYLAAAQQKPINIGYVARYDRRAMKAYQDSLVRALEDGHISSKTLYITTAPNLLHFSAPLQSDAAQIHTLGGYYYLYAEGIRNPQLDTMNARLDAANKGRLDSVLAAARIKNEFVATDKIDSPGQSSIHYYFDRLNKGSNYISISGWGFIDSTQNNKGDSIYFTLQSAGKSYMAPAVIEQLPYLSDRFQKTYLGDGGYFLLAYYDSLPAGEYQLGIAIKDQQGRYIYQPDKNKISVQGPGK